jgi:hypothetical protein
MSDEQRWNERFPEFYIFGAPKCGTTALHEYLDLHPGVCMSRVKEPQYFCSDFPDIRQIPDSVSAYMDLFADARAGQIRGESSVWYLFSREAAANVAAARPDARVIVMLRNPVEAAHSMHGQAQLTLREDEPSFERAWDLQDERAAGRRLPAYCPHPESLQYRDVFRYVPQLQRLWDHFPREQTKIIIFDDFKADPAGVYRDVVEFLGLPPHDLAEYPRVNEAKALRSQPLLRVLAAPPYILRPFVLPIKKSLNRIGIKPSTLLARKFVEPRAREPLTPELYGRVAEAFREDVSCLSRLLGRDLGAWLSRRSSSANDQNASGEERPKAAGDKAPV